jgi:hypothetical protein
MAGSAWSSKVVYEKVAGDVAINELPGRLTGNFGGGASHEHVHDNLFHAIIKKDIPVQYND